MPESLLTDVFAWWQELTPGFAFLQMLPFAVAALALLADRWRRRRPGS